MDLKPRSAKSGHPGGDPQTNVLGIARVRYNSLNISRGRAMKIQLALLALLALTLSLLGSAQSRTGGRKSPGITRTPQLGTPVRGSIFLSGRVVLEDGSELTEQVSIQTICRGQKRTETHSDSHGNFSFELGNQNPMSVAAGMMDADTSFSEGMSTTRGNQRDATVNCKPCCRDFLLSPSNLTQGFPASRAAILAASRYTAWPTSMVLPSV